MNGIVICLAGVIFVLGILFRIYFALFFPDRFSEGARKVLFLEQREKKLFRSAKKKQQQYGHDEETSSK